MADLRALAESVVDELRGVVEARARDVSAVARAVSVFERAAANASQPLFAKADRRALDCLANTRRALLSERGAFYAAVRRRAWKLAAREAHGVQLSVGYLAFVLSEAVDRDQEAPEGMLDRVEKWLKGQRGVITEDQVLQRYFAGRVPGDIDKGRTAQRIVSELRGRRGLRLESMADFKKRGETPPAEKGWIRAR